MPYERCYLADGCGGDEACVALCPARSRTSGFCLQCGMVCYDPTHEADYRQTNDEVGR